MVNLSDRTAAEEARIRSAYAKRCSGFHYSWFHPGHLFLLQGLERRVLALLHAQGWRSLTDKQILEIGCGEGYWLRECIKWGADPENITGIDLLPDRIAKAKKLCPQGVTIRCDNAAKLALDSASFDLVFQFTVFTSIFDFTMKKRIAQEMLRVSRKDGLIIWYDFYMNNPRNPDVRGIRKHEITQLFPNCRIELHRVTLAPPVTRFLAPFSWAACYALEGSRLFNTHYLGVIRRN